MGEGLVLDLGELLTQEEEATQGPQESSLAINGSDWAFIDGDTIFNSKTGKSIRLDGIDTRETAKFIKEKPYSESEIGADSATSYIASLANEYGFNREVYSGEKGYYDRDLGDLYNADGESFVQTLIKAGVVSPSRFSGGDDLGNVLASNFAEKSRNSDKVLGSARDLTPFEQARQAIHEVETDPYGGMAVQKLMAFDAAEFARNPNFYMGIKTINAGADYEGKSRTPFGTGFDVGFANLYKGLNTFGQALSDRVGAEEMEASFAADAVKNQRYINAQPLLNMNVTEMDWTSFDEVSSGLRGMLGSSLPFMGATLAGMAAMPVTGGTSIALPVSVYTGMVLDTMEGDIADKNIGIAMVAGTAMTFLDRLGLKGLVSPKMMLTKEGRTEAISQIARVKGISNAEASSLLLSMSKRELLSQIDNSKEFAANQIQKGHLFRESVKRLSRGTAQEGVTEAMQELTEYTAAVIGSEKQWDYDEIENRMINAIVAGGIMGAGFSAPGTAFQVADWHAAADIDSEVDNRFDNQVHSNIVKQQEDSRGYIQTVESITSTNSVEEKVFQEKMAEQKFDKAEAQETGRSWDPDNDLANPRSVDDWAEMHDRPNTSLAWIKSFAKNPKVALRGTMDNAIQKLEGVSTTAVKMVDMIGSYRNRVFPGKNMVMSQQLKVAEYDGMLSPQEEIEASFKTPRGLSSSGRSDFVSKLMYKYNEELLKPARESGKPVDWSKASDDLVSNKQALLRYDKELLARSNAMLRDNNIAIEDSNTVANSQDPIEVLQDWSYRHKNLLTEYIANHKVEFINTLMSSYELDYNTALDLTDSIIHDQTVNTIGDAFDVTKHGLNPSYNKQRKMNISDRPEFSKFLEQNIFKNMGDASRSSARFQAHRKFIGKDSVYLNRMLNDTYVEVRNAKGEEAAIKHTAELAHDIRNALNAESGNYKRIENQNLKQAQKYLTVVTMLQSLSNAAFSSIPEVAMIFNGVPRDVMVKNTATYGYLFGNAVGSWIRNLGVVARVAKPRDAIETIIEKKLAEYRSKGDNDPRFIYYTDMKEMLRSTGFMSQETGAATTTGVQETNQLTKGMADAFFKANFLHDQQDMHRMMRLSLFNDFLIGKIDLIDRYEGQADTVGVAEAKKMLRDLGIPLSSLQPLSHKMKRGEALTETEAAIYKDVFLNGAANFVNQAIPMPNALNRPLIYSDPHFAMLTQFNGFTSTFQANQIPMMWDQVKRGGPSSKGLTYGTFASASTMLLLAFASQGIKDELKYGESSPYLSDPQKIQRAIYSSGLLGTMERVIGSDFLFPLYPESSYGASEYVWDHVAGEAPAAGTVERAYGIIEGLITSDDDQFKRNLYGSIPIFAPYKNRMINWNTDD